MSPGCRQRRPSGPDSRYRVNFFLHWVTQALLAILSPRDRRCFSDTPLGYCFQRLERAVPVARRTSPRSRCSSRLTIPARRPPTSPSPHPPARGPRGSLRALEYVRLFGGDRDRRDPPFATTRSTFGRPRSNPRSRRPKTDTPSVVDLGLEGVVRFPVNT